jgi:nicotinamidase-related amidase
VETHVCVRQSALDALSLGKKVTIVADAVGSRHKTDHEKALAELREAGASILTVESLVFEWMEDSKHPQFKNVSALFKGKN